VSFLTGAGYLLGDHYDLVDEYLGPVSKIVLLSLIIWFGLWILRRNMRKNAE
jgi:membrane protein DedA with SNARE-associated domain